MTMPSPKRTTAYRFGLTAETFAALFLRLKGYRIVARRHRNYAGEIDIIASRGRTLCFVEVKARTAHTQLADILTVRQQQRILQAAEIFLSQHLRYQGYAIRFDLIIIAPRRLPQHMHDAWRGW